MIGVLLRILTNGISLLSSYQYRVLCLLKGLFFFLPKTYTDFKCKNSLSFVKILDVFFHTILTSALVSGFSVLFSNTLIRIQGNTVSKRYETVLLVLVMSRILIPIQI